MIPPRGAAFYSVLVLFMVCQAASLAIPSASEPETEIQELVERDRASERRMVGIVGAGVSNPQVVTGSVGFLVFHQPVNYDCTTLCDFKGGIFQFEPGIGGGRLSAGYALVIGEKTRNRYFLSDVYMGLGVKGSLLRTWGSSMIDPPDQTFVGIEGEFTIIQINFSLGVFHRVGREELDDPWKITGGIGWGF